MDLEDVVGSTLYLAVLLVLLRDVVMWVVRGGTWPLILVVTGVAIAAAGLWYGEFTLPNTRSANIIRLVSFGVLALLCVSAFVSQLRREERPARRFTSLVGHGFIYAGFVGNLRDILEPPSASMPILFGLFALGFSFEIAASLLPKSKGVAADSLAPNPVQTKRTGRSIPLWRIAINGLGLVASVLGIFDFILNRLR